MLALANFFYNFYDKARSSDRAQLVTIAISHYCEFAQWTLERGSKIIFETYACSPGEHVLPTLSIRLPSDRNRKKQLHSSSRIVPVGAEARERKEGGATSVPVLVLPSGEVLNDSWEIAKRSGLKDIDDEELKQLLDVDVGVGTRHIVYSYLLTPAGRPYFDRLCLHGHGWLFSMIWWMFLGSALFGRMIQTFQPENVEHTRKVREKLQAAVNSLDKRLEEKKTKYFAGDTPGVADYAIASLLAPVLCPKLYVAGTYYQHFAEFEASNPAFKKELDHWRATAIGRFSLELYESHRKN
jgi:glutathione S-transferase